MAITTSQQLQRYFDLYKSLDITFTKDVVKFLGFLNDQIFLKILGFQWPCVIYSTSFEGAKIILNIRPDQMERLRQGSNLGALRFSFRLPDKTEPLSFFVTSRVKGFNKYNSNSPDLYFMTLEFTQRPPDDLIEIVGKFLEINVNSKQRKDERVPISEQMIKKLGFATTSGVLHVAGNDRKCLIRDLSFGGARLVIPGSTDNMQGIPLVLRLQIQDSGKSLEIAGSLIRVELVEGRTDISVGAMQFDDNGVPQEFKMILSNWLQQNKKNTDSTTK